MNLRVELLNLSYNTCERRSDAPTQFATKSHCGRHSELPQLAVDRIRGTRYWKRLPTGSVRKLEKSRFPQPANFTGLPSRDSLGVYHAISRLLGQFETFGACWAGGESRDLVAATITESRG